MIARKAEIVGLLFLCALGIAGCAASYQEELRQWMRWIVEMQIKHFAFSCRMHKTEDQIH